MSASSGPMLHVAGSNAWIVGGYGDNFTYDGSTYTPTNGFVTIDVNDESNEGTVIGEWGVDNWEYDASKPPATGRMKVVWTTFDGPADFMDGGIASDLMLHGNSGQEAPVLPTVFSHSAGWGHADVYLNDEILYEGVVAHYMVTEGTRDPITHAIHKGDGTGMFVPTPMGGDSDDGFVYPDQILTHLVVHTDEPDPANFPGFTMFMHINFENNAVSSVSMQ